MDNSIAIIGYGYVGKAMHKIFPAAQIFDTRFEAEGVRPRPQLEISSRERINTTCELAVICVPTPMQESGGEFKPVDLSIVEEVVSWLDTPLILLKSTVPPGTTEELERRTGKNICFSPEYVGEGKYHISPWRYMSPADPATHDFVIIGGRPGIRDRVANVFVRHLGPEKMYYLVDSTEAEIVKYMENSWGALKVIFANEFYQLCERLGASYIRVREGWALDNRVERMHTAVFVDRQGFDGKCYPKDLNGIVAAADQVGVDMSLLKTALRKNRRLHFERRAADPIEVAV
jgi:nucleotide sugar dehydrogenase